MIKKQDLQIITKLFLFIFLCFSIYHFYSRNTNIIEIEKYNPDQITIQHKFLTINPYSRSGRPLKKIKGIVVHYTGNPGSSARSNRDYFENLKKTHTTKASSHFIIGLKGEIIQCIPLNEISYASNQRNKDTISIECCHPDSSGKFTNATYKSLQLLLRNLMQTYHLDKNDIIRHYDVTKKLCPLYFVKNPKEWKKLLNSL